MSSAAVNRPGSVSLMDSEAFRSKIKLGPFSTRVSSLAIPKVSGSNRWSVGPAAFA